MEQTDKTEVLEKAVINNTPKEIEHLIKGLGYMEFTARALGTACRFRGLETVKVLAENGASFDIPKIEEIEETYSCYSGTKYDNYRSNFALCLLNIFNHIKGACCLKGVKLLKQAKRTDGSVLRPIPDEERLRVLKYLCENKEKLSFDPSEMLYYAIFAKDGLIVRELKNSGVTVLERRKKTLINGGAYTDGYWYEYCAMTGRMDEGNYLPVMSALAAELGGNKLHCTDKIYELIKRFFANKEIFGFFLENFNYEKLNKTQIIKDLIDESAAESLALTEGIGWLDNIKRRDDAIKYSQDKGSTECTAFLLNFKNRTADLAAERERAEKKMMSELNAAPDSVIALKKIWSYKKGGDGGLIITSYKGNATEVTIPEKIGKSKVTAIGKGAFAGGSGLCAGLVSTNADYNLQSTRRKIQKITLPDGIKSIGTGAFADITALKEINIPDTVEKIGAAAFYQSVSLKKLVIPETVKIIGKYAFAHCKSLAYIKIGGAEEIGAGAFRDDPYLSVAVLPSSLKSILFEETYYHRVEAFDGCPLVTVHCPKGSYAEKYCKKMGIKIKYILREQEQ